MKYIQEVNERTKKKPSIKAKITFIMALLEFDIGIRILVPIIGGLTLGVVFDNLLRIKPTLTVAFLFLGVAASFYNIYKLIKKTNASH